MELAQTASRTRKLALVPGSSERALEAAHAMRDACEWVPLEDADTAIVLGGDGTMLDTLHAMIDAGRTIPAYGLNLGTVGFLMNRYDRKLDLAKRLSRARPVAVSPLLMDARMQDGRTCRSYAINEVSLLRETRQTAKIEISVNDRVRIAELACDGVLLATPVGSTAYNYSASGPILPLDSQVLALTPISPFRPRRWRGAILPDRMKVGFRILEPDKRPVSAVADQKELRDVAEINIAVAPEISMTLLFDPGHALDERIVAEQFAF